MTYTEQAVELGKELLMEVAVKITADDALEVVDSMVKTAVSKDMTGKQKFDWVVATLIEMAVDVWDIILPLVVQAVYNAAKERGELYVNSK